MRREMERRNSLRRIIRDEEQEEGERDMRLEEGNQSIHFLLLVTSFYIGEKSPLTDARAMCFVIV